MQETPVWLLGQEDPLEQEGIGYPLQYSWASLVAQLVKNLPGMRETWVRSLGWEETLEKRIATHSSILAWRIPWAIHGVAKSWTRLTFTSLLHSNPLGWHPRATAQLFTKHTFPLPPSTATQPPHGSHNSIPSIQSKHVITDLRLIDAICVPWLLGFSWSPRNGDGHHPWNLKALTTLASGRIPSTVLL